MSEAAMHVEDAVDNKLAKAVVKAAVWAMPFIFTGVVSLVAWQLREIKAEQRAASAKAELKAEEQSRVTASIASDVRDLNTRFDLIAVKQLDALEKRVERIEQATRTP